MKRVTSPVVEYIAARIGESFWRAGADFSQAAMVGGSPPESQQVGRGALDRVVPSGSGIVAFDKLTGAVKYKLADELASYASLKLATIAGRRAARHLVVGADAGVLPGLRRGERAADAVERDGVDVAL